MADNGSNSNFHLNPRSREEGFQSELEIEGGREGGGGGVPVPVPIGTRVGEKVLQLEMEFKIGAGCSS